MPEQDLIQSCLRYIGCDAPGCSRRNPQVFCTKCHLVHYCSRDCQNRHAESHEQSECLALEQMRATMVLAETTTTEEAVLETDNDKIQQVLDAQPSCGICLGEQLTNPIVLKKCHHAFCFGCLKQWNDYQTLSPSSTDIDNNDNNNNNAVEPRSTCPVCRQEIPHLAHSLLESVMRNMAAAQKSTITEKERERYCQLATKDVENLNSAPMPANPKQEQKQQAQLGILEGELAILTKDYDKALQIFKNTSTLLEAAVERGNQLEALTRRGDMLVQARDNLDDSNDSSELEQIIGQMQSIRRQGITASPSTYAVCCLKIGQVQRLQMDYLGAKLTYQALMEKYPQQSDLTPAQHREIFMSLSECAYYLERYDIAIGLGKAALEMNRYFPWSHKFVALAYREQGNLAQAVQLAAEAVVYEAPWDYQHLQEVEAWYQKEFGSIEEEDVAISVQTNGLSKLIRLFSVLAVLVAILVAYYVKNVK